MDKYSEQSAQRHQRFLTLKTQCINYIKTVNPTFVVSHVCIFYNKYAKLVLKVYGNGEQSSRGKWSFPVYEFVV